MVWLLNSQWMENCKSTESFCLSIITVYTNNWSTFWHVYCCRVYFFCEFLNMCKPRTGWPTWIDILLKWASMLTQLPEVGECICWLGSMQSEVFITSCKLNLPFFKAVPPNRLHFYLSAPHNQLIIQPRLFQKAILHKMLKVGFWNFMPIFLRM